MLSKQDDFIGHQLPTTFDHVMSSDPAWMERLWYTAIRSPAAISLRYRARLASEPQCHGRVRRRRLRRQAIQFPRSRRLRPDPLETTIGPLEIEILEGLRRHRLTLKPNPSGLAFDLEFLATMNPHEEGEHFRRRSGRVTEHMARAQQLGAYSGWVEAAGERREVNGRAGSASATIPGASAPRCAPTRAIRRSPSTRLSSIAGRPHSSRIAACTVLQGARSGEKIYISGEEVRALGTRSKESVRLDDVSHDMAWAKDPLGQTLESAEFDARFSDGSTRKLEDSRPSRPVLPQGRPLRRPERLVAWRRQGQVLRGARCLDWQSRRPASSHDAERPCDRSDRRRRGRLRHRRIWGGQGIRRLCEVQDHPPI